MASRKACGLSGPSQFFPLPPPPLPPPPFPRRAPPGRGGRRASPKVSLSMLRILATSALGRSAAPERSVASQEMLSKKDLALLYPSSGFRAPPPSSSCNAFSISALSNFSLAAVTSNSAANSFLTCSFTSGTSSPMEGPPSPLERPPPPPPPPPLFPPLPLDLPPLAAPLEEAFPPVSPFPEALPLPLDTSPFDDALPLDGGSGTPLPPDLPLPTGSALPPLLPLLPVS
mmetsp:Transcript_82241/g.148407  ORF Transcript_82241/g.148407 Transcript_82241/m.148407 type:complete len:229 (+) Transcript_82241:79-765(+)